MTRVRALVIAAACLTVTFSSTACSSSSNSTNGSSSVASGATVTIGAASSLTGAFTTIGKDFMAVNPGITVQFSFAASSAIAEQLRAGAPLDGFASAGVSSMDPVAKDGLVTGVVDFASNSLEIAVPPSNPAKITGLADLSKGSLVVCQDQVPCGVAYTKLVAANNLTLTPVSLEPDVKSVLTKVEADEADAGIVYVTDVLAAGDKVVGIKIPAANNVTTTYQIATVAASSQGAAMQAFINYVTSPAGQSVLTAAGFAGP